MSTRTTCELTYNTSLDGTRVVRIPDPNPGITPAAVEFAASMLRTSQPFDETVGQLQSLRRADIVTVERNPLIAPA
jgi:hypothetical protein